MGSATVMKKHLQNITLNDQMDVLVEKIDVERNHIKKLNSQISVYKAQAIEQQKKVGGVDAIKETSRMIGKTRKIIEARLNQSLVNFNEHVDQNKRIRKQIDDLRQERVVYDSIYKKLERELQIKAKEMKRIVGEGRTIVISRERAFVELQELQRVEQEEKNMYEREYQEFELQKEKFEMEKRKRRRIRVGTQPPINVGEVTKQVTYRDGIKNVIELEHTANESQSTIDHDASSDINYSEVIAKIKDATGFVSIDEITSQLSEVQARNFSLFNYCSDATAEIESLETKLAETREEMEQHKSIIKNSPRKKTEHLLNEKKKKIEAKNEKYEKQVQQLDRTLIQFKDAILRIFINIGCAVPREDELLGNHITDANIIQYLAIVEQVSFQFNLIDETIFENEHKSFMIPDPSSLCNERYLLTAA